MTDSLQKTAESLDTQKLLEERKAISTEHQQGLDDWMNRIKQSSTWGEAWGKPIFPAQQLMSRQESNSSSADGVSGMLIVLLIVPVLFYFFRNKLVNTFSKRTHGIALIICYIFLLIDVGFDFISILGIIFNWTLVVTFLLGILGGIRLIIGGEKEVSSGDLKNKTIGIFTIVTYILLVIDEFYYDLDSLIGAISMTLIIFGAIIFGIYGAWRLIKSSSTNEH